MLGKSIQPRTLIDFHFVKPGQGRGWPGFHFAKSGQGRAWVDVHFVKPVHPPNLHRFSLCKTGTRSGLARFSLCKIDPTPSLHRLSPHKPQNLPDQAAIIPGCCGLGKRREKSRGQSGWRARRAELQIGSRNPDVAACDFCDERAQAWVCLAAFVDDLAFAVVPHDRAIGIWILAVCR